MAVFIAWLTPEVAYAGDTAFDLNPSDGSGGVVTKWEKDRVKKNTFPE